MLTSTMIHLAQAYNGLIVVARFEKRPHQSVGTMNTYNRFHRDERLDEFNMRFVFELTDMGCSEDLVGQVEIVTFIGISASS